MLPRVTPLQPDASLGDINDFYAQYSAPPDTFQNFTGPQQPITYETNLPGSLPIDITPKLLTGDSGNNILSGLGGNDTLIGGAGDDTLNGGYGNDTFIATIGDGCDRYDGGADGQVFVGGVITNAGNTYDASAITTQVIINLARSKATGVDIGTDVVLNIENAIGGTGNDSLTGNALNNLLVGGAGNDTLNGGVGVDSMAGGAGNDTYYIDSVGDTVIENANEGTDTVYVSTNYALAAATEVEVLRAYAAATGLILDGNAFTHTIIGGAGNDGLFLIDGAGNDTLNGGAGADSLVGGMGNDAYFVDNLCDIVRESVGAGTDTVFASASFTLTAGSEVEILRANAGATPLALTGNEFANTIVGGTGNDTLVGGAGNDTLSGNAGKDSLDGGAGNDVLNGGVGADTMTGGIGNDTYTVDNIGDVVTEGVGQGTDTVLTTVSYSLAAGSEIEFLRVSGGVGLSLTGNEFANTLVGGNGSDTLSGGAGNDVLKSGVGNDVLIGGPGNDTLIGGVGADVFRFVTGFGNDVLGDFTLGQDKLDLSGLGITSAGNFSALARINAAGTATITIGVDTIRLNGISATTLHVTDPSVFVA